MQDRSRPFVGLALGLTSLGLLMGQAAPEGVTVTVKVTGIRNAEGVVRACMTTDARKFPRCQGNPDAHSTVVNAATSVTLTFRGVKPGHYALALLHDENNNGKADRALGMMPREGYGFSRDAPVRMGPPRFEQAAFDIAGAPQTLTVKMRYWL